MAEGKTEKATPKRREEARKKGQVARSIDVNGAVVLTAGLLALSAFGPKMLEQLRQGMTDSIALMSTPDAVSAANLANLLEMVGTHVVLATLPVTLVCMLAGVAAGAARSGSSRRSARSPRSSPSSTRPTASRTSSARTCSPRRASRS